MKRAGYCTLCEEPVFEFKGERPSLPKDNAWRATFLLSDDTEADITFCEDCLEAAPEKMDEIWRIVLERFDFEEKQRPGRASAQVDAFMDHIKEQHLMRLTNKMRWSALL